MEDRFALSETKRLALLKGAARAKVPDDDPLHEAEIRILKPQ